MQIYVFYQNSGSSAYLFPCEKMLVEKNCREFSFSMEQTQNLYFFTPKNSQKGNFSKNISP